MVTVPCTHDTRGFGKLSHDFTGNNPVALLPGAFVTESKSIAFAALYVSLAKHMRKACAPSPWS